jgi:hypothetical protein
MPTSQQTTLLFHLRGIGKASGQKCRKQCPACGELRLGKDRGRTSKYQNYLQCDYAGELIY